MHHSVDESKVNGDEAVAEGDVGCQIKRGSVDSPHPWHIDDENGLLRQNVLSPAIIRLR